jgi:hypothetical protein
MSANTKSIQVQNINNSDDNSKTIDVLYQKMGDRWYAFSMVGEELFMGSVTEEEVNNAAQNDDFIETVLVDPTETFHEVA